MIRHVCSFVTGHSLVLPLSKEKRLQTSLKIFPPCDGHLKRRSLERVLDCLIPTLPPPPPLPGHSILHRGSCPSAHVVHTGSLESLALSQGPSSVLTSMVIRKMRWGDTEKDCLLNDVSLNNIYQKTAIFRGHTGNFRRHIEI